MANKKDFKPVTTGAITFYGIYVIAYAYIALFGFGAERSQRPLVTESLQRKSRRTTHAAAPTVWFRSRSTDCRGSLFL